MPNEINEKTKIGVTIGVWFSSVGVLIILIFGAGIIYSDHKDLPVKIRDRDRRLQKLETRSKEEYRVIKLLQNQIVPERYREPINCD
ncbi:MAG: hypothetical protein L6Q54_15770 [Leptospiraceae bacterium]|nr:hypothetical protein [Leptospiraceae bacterium]MCK6382694.1 hypothetical protein [Leptospiraceae bacterium]